MSCFLPTLRVLSSILSILLALDLPAVSARGEKTYKPTSHSIEEYSVRHQWIPASAVPMGDHGIDLGVFPKDSSSRVELLLRERVAEDSPSSSSLAAIPAGGCSQSIDVSDFFPGGRTFDAMLGDSTAIFSGTIISKEPGFFRGIPVLLMRLKIDSVVLPPPAYREQFVDVFYPHANFMLHGYKICGIKAYEEVDPQVGNKALVFAAEAVPSRGIAALNLAPERVAIESAEGKLSLPRPLRLDRRLFAAESLSEVENISRRSLAQLPPGAR